MALQAKTRRLLDGFGVRDIEREVSTPLLLLTESLSLSENDRESCNSVRPSLNIHCSVLLSR